MEILKSLDLAILYFFNHSLSCRLLDVFFGFITDVTNWYIAYLALAGAAWYRGGTKARITIVVLLLMIAVTDLTGYRILKEIFERIRPCNALEDILTPIGCVGVFSFPSNHALNNFAAATFLGRLYPPYRWVLFSAAVLISISRVYLGVHYPSDIIGGAVFGIGFGYLFSSATLRLKYNRIFQWRNDV